MIHALRIAAHVILYTILSLTGLVLVVCLLILLPPVQHVIKDKVEAALSDQLIGEVSFSSAHLILLNGVTVRHIVIRDPRAQDSVAIGYLHVGWALLPLLHKTISIRKITVHNAYIGVVRMENGELRLPFMPAHPAKKPARKSSWKLSLGPVTIKNLRIKYGDSVSKVFGDIGRITGRFEFFTLDSLRAKVGAGPGSIRSPWYRNSIREIEIRGIFSRSNADLAKLLVSGDSLRLTVQGTLPLAKGRPLDVRARLETGLASIVALGHVKGLSAGGGRLVVDAAINGPPASPSAAVRSRLTGVRFDRIAVERVDLDLNHAPDGRTAGTLALATDVGEVRADVKADLPVLTPKPVIRRYAATVDAGFPSLSEVASRFGVKKTFVDGPVRLSVQARGAGSATLPEYARIALTVANAGRPGEMLVRCDGAIENRRWKLLLGLDSANRVRSQGIIGTDQRVAGTFSIALDNPAFITRLLFSERVSGAIDGNGTIRGTVSAPAIDGTITGKMLSWRGDTVRSLTVSAAYSKRSVTIRRSSLEALGALQRVLPRFGIDAGGDFRLAASASGPLDRLTAKASLSVEQVHYAAFDASSLHGEFTYRSDTLHISPLRLDKDTAHIAITGIAGMKGKRRFASVSVIADRKGVPRGTLLASAAQTDAAIKASVATTGFDLALIGPWLATPPPVQGTVRLTATAGGTRQNPSGNVDLDLQQTLAGEQVNWKVSATLRNLLLKASAAVYYRGEAEPFLVTASLPMSFRPPLKPARMIREGARITMACTDFDVTRLLGSFAPQVKGEGRFSIQATAVKRPPTWVVQARLQGKVADLADTVSGTHVHGLTATLGASGTIAHPLFALDAAADSLRFKGFTFSNTDLRVRGTAAMLVIDTVTSSLGGGRLSLSGSLPWTGLKPSVSGVRLLLDARDLPLTALSVFAPQAGVTAGVVNCRATIAMQGGAPWIHGTLSLRNAMARLDDCDPQAGPVSADLLFRGDSIVIESLDGQIGSGRLDGNGFVEIGGARHARLSINATNLRQRCSDMDLGLLRVALRVADSAGVLVAGGRITLAPSRYSLFISPAALTKKAPPKPVPKRQEEKKSTPAPERAALRTIIDLNRNLTIESNLGRIVLDGTITIVGSPSHPGVVGTVSAVEGYVYYLDQKFTIQQATFSFFNPKEINPQINLSATTQVTSYGTSTTTRTPTQQVTYTITVSVTGDAKKPTVALTSQPPLAPAAIVSLITFGTTQGVAGGEFSRKIQGFLAQQIAGFGTRPLEQLLGLETLTIETQGSSGATLTATKRLSSRLAVTYQTALQNLGAPTVSASYRLLPFLYLEGTGYSLNAGSVDLHFRITR